MSLSKSYLKVAISAIALLAAAQAHAEEVKVGALGGITGPIAALAPPILAAGNLAAAQVNAAGGLMNGKTLKVVTGDSQCSAQGAVDAATKLVNVEQVAAMFGPMCSGATAAAANSVMVPAGVLTISASATSPEITKVKDKDLLFRTAPSDAYQGAAMAKYLFEKRGLKKVAVTYINNDYGVGLEETFVKAFKDLGGEVTASQAHEGKKASYRSELATLAKGGAETLVVFSYENDAGLTIVRESLENGLFGKFVGSDGMKGDNLIKELGAGNLGNFIVTAPTSDSESASWKLFSEQFKKAGGAPDGTFVGQGYDAVMLIALAIEKAGSTDRAAVAKALRAVSSAPGEPVGPGDWAKAKKLIAEGKDIDYKGAVGDHEFDKNGDVSGIYSVYSVKGGKFTEIDVAK